MGKKQNKTKQHAGNWCSCTEISEYVCITSTWHANMCQALLQAIYTYVCIYTHIYVCVDSRNTGTYLFPKEVCFHFTEQLPASEFHFCLWRGRVWRLFICLSSPGSKISNDEIQKHILSECRLLLNQLLHYYFASFTVSACLHNYFKLTFGFFKLLKTKTAVECFAEQ